MGLAYGTRVLCAFGFLLVACGDDGGSDPPTAANETGAGGAGFGALVPPNVEQGEWRGLTAQGTTIGFAVGPAGLERLDLVWRLKGCEMRQSFRFEEALPIAESSLSAELQTDPGDSRATVELTFAGSDRALGLLTWTTSAIPEQPGCSGLGEAVFTAAPVADGGENAP